MIKNFRVLYTLKDVLTELNGYGITVTNLDLIGEILSAMGLDLDSQIRSYDEEE